VADPKPQPTFSADITVVKEFVLRESIVEITFSRDGAPVPRGVVQLNNMDVPGTGARYAINTTLDKIFRGQNTITFISPDDDYEETVAIGMPDSFGVRNINPRDNSGVVDVIIEWTRPDFASLVLLIVVARDYPINNTNPYMVILNSDITVHTVPYTAFEASSGLPVDDIYYVYLVAFNQGFGEYDGMQSPLPEGLPQRRLSNPAGFARYGVVAPYDSILVLP
jgi:hypothetical protein